MILFVATSSLESAMFTVQPRRYLSKRHILHGIVYKLIPLLVEEHQSLSSSSLLPYPSQKTYSKRIRKVHCLMPKLSLYLPVGTMIDPIPCN
mmetsp:Transcript_29502/g.44677  ORF Transcript_29502/g.44677 Transcript_29502/m.44677 type:complete len:92 (-) Transcript_29502:42-317(-)